MSNVISREVVEELRRHKAGQAPKPKLRRESVTFKPNSEDEISRLVAALVMAIQECPAARTQAGAPKEEITSSPRSASQGRGPILAPRPVAYSNLFYRSNRCLVRQSDEERLARDQLQTTERSALKSRGFCIQP
jgi:hypothetical protein